MSRLDLTFETDRYGNIDLLAPGQHGPRVLAIAFKERTPNPNAYKVHDIAKGGHPTRCLTRGGALRVMLRIAGVAE